MLAKILQRRYTVEIIGPEFGDGIWFPLSSDNTILYKPVKMMYSADFIKNIPRLIKLIKGDILYVSKPLFTSFNISLFRKIFHNRAVILDIDDWEVGYYEQYNNKRLALRNRLGLFKHHLSDFINHPNSYWLAIASEKLIGLADNITVSNTFLKSKFGGTIIWHARDTTDFDPEKFNKKRLRFDCGLPEKESIVIFLGTPHKHKGIEDLITSLVLLSKHLLVIVGLEDNGYSQRIVDLGKEKLGKRLYCFPKQPFNKIPEFLAMSDIVVIPQQDTYFSQFQVPAKVFDAMAMGKPIIATKVGDLPEILNGCGWLIDPGNIEQLMQTIVFVLNHPIEATIVGQKARRKCIEKYSWDAVEKTLVNIFKRYE